MPVQSPELHRCRGRQEHAAPGQPPRALPTWPSASQPPRGRQRRGRHLAWRGATAGPHRGPSAASPSPSCRNGRDVQCALFFVNYVFHFSVLAGARHVSFGCAAQCSRLRVTRGAITPISPAVCGGFALCPPRRSHTRCCVSASPRLPPRPLGLLSGALCFVYFVSRSPFVQSHGICPRLAPLSARPPGPPLPLCRSPFVVPVVSFHLRGLS